MARVTNSLISSVQPVDAVVACGNVLGERAIVLAKSGDEVAVHVLDEIAQPQRLARRDRQRGIEIIAVVLLEQPRTAGLDALARIDGQARIEHPGDEAEEGQEHQRDQHVERHVRADRERRRGQPERRRRLDDHADERQQHDDPGAAKEQVADRYAPRRRALPGGGAPRRQPRPEIGAEHEHQRHALVDHAGGGKRHGEQHRRRARMQQPGQKCEHGDGDHRLVGQGAQHDRQHVRLGKLRGVAAQQLQRQQHDAEAHAHARVLLDGPVLSCTVDDEADADQERREPRQVVAQYRRDNRGADIGAEHKRQRRAGGDGPLHHEADHQQRGGGAALQRHRKGGAGTERHHAMLQPALEQHGQARAECTLHARAHHAHAPQEQRHRADDMNEEKRRRHSVSSPDRSSFQPVGVRAAGRFPFVRARETERT
ncbi:MAG: hypothetical protein M5U09_16445 [Gammaproteobacteria bacterium]|nr:hypothetical protein [Gammaproteobacteria bacterium]